MKRIEGTAIVAWWLLGTAVFALARLVARTDDILRHLDGWRAAAGPLLVAVLAIVAAIQLLRGGRGSQLAAGVLSVQLFALSAGALAFRLDVGPFIRLGITGTGLWADAGNDARLLAIIGAENHVPWDIAVNLLALAALLILVAGASDRHRRARWLTNAEADKCRPYPLVAPVVTSSPMRGQSGCEFLGG